MARLCIGCVWWTMRFQYVVRLMAVCVAMDQLLKMRSEMLRMGGNGAKQNASFAVDLGGA